MPVKQTRRREERADETRAKLLATARELFAKHGYAEVSVDQIALAARVTKGALYHHFRDKQEVFVGAVEQILGSIQARLSAAEGLAEPRERLRAACHAYLDACTEADVGRIVVLDCPSVLGWERWCALNRQYGLGVISDCLRALRPDEGAVESTAVVILGALNTAGRVIAQAADRQQARQEVEATIDRLVTTS